MLTGGAGFLGRSVREKLVQAGAAEVLVPRRDEYDLTNADAVRGAYQDFAPDASSIWPAEVGGIGANRDNPGRYFYANMAMRLHLIEEARKRELLQVRAGRHRVRLSQVRAGAGPRGRPVEGLSRGDDAPYGVAKKALLVMLPAYREQYGLNGIFLLAGEPLRSGR